MPDQQGHSEHDDADGCVCDSPIEDIDLTLDEELPAASGGLEAAASDHGDGEEEADGCGHDLAEAEMTLDEELPEASGGVS